MIRLSIIVITYNVEDYIEDCLQSIVEQSNEYCEVIVVDDGSTDGTISIIEKFRKYGIDFYSKQNGGPSSARNYGINKAKGDYLMFVDGDDYICPDSIRIINESINKYKSDIIQFKMSQYYGKKKKTIQSVDLPDLKNSTVCDALRELNKKGLVSVSPCDKIVRRNLIIDNNAFFEENLLSEDVHWSLTLYRKTNTYSAVNRTIYVYRQQRQGSTSTTKSRKLAKDLLKIVNYWIDYDYEDKNERELYYNILAFWVLVLRAKFGKKDFNDRDRKRLLALTKQLIVYDDNYKVAKACKLQKKIGLKATIVIMKSYLFVKNRGLLKI